MPSTPSWLTPEQHTTLDKLGRRFGALSIRCSPSDGAALVRTVGANCPQHFTIDAGGQCWHWTSMGV